MKDGDRDNKFFHRLANSRGKFNVTPRIKVDNQVFDKDSTLKGAIVHYCENPHHEDYPARPILDGIPYSSVGIDDALDLERHFSEEEVYSAIKI